MSGTLIHLAVADKIYDISGSSIVKNLPLFFGGNIAPDAVHAKEDYQRRDKKHSHLCDDIYSYGYGYPQMNKLFRRRVNEFAENYYQTAGKDKDLYLGYIIHLLVDEFDMYSAFERLIAQLGESKINFDKPGSRKRLADEVNCGSYRDFFVEDASGYDISAREYRFTQNVVDILESVWDYEVKDYISSDEINTSKLWVINNVLKREPVHNELVGNDPLKAVEFIDLAAEHVLEQLHHII